MIGIAKLEPQNEQNVESKLEDQSRPEKKLARGLEDISYLFLSQTGRQTGQTGQTGNDKRSESAAMPVLLRAAPAIDRNMLVSLLGKNPAVLEDGLRCIDANIPCDLFGSIDLLLLDAQNCLVIMNVDAVPNDSSFLRGIGNYDWLVRNAPILQRIYQGRVIDFSAQPRLFLMAPGFSLLLKCAAQRNVNPKVNCFGYRTVALPGGAGVFFEQV
jgi:hypothetical protein